MQQSALPSGILTCLFAEQVHQISFDKLEMAPATLAELVCAIDEGLVSGKIGKQVLPMLLQVRFLGELISNICTCESFKNIQS